jgi:hypothetical protein
MSALFLVSALERSLRTEEEVPVLRVSRCETECDVLYREIHALSDAADELRRIAAALSGGDGRDDHREFKCLRGVLRERCDLSPALLGYAWAEGLVERGPLAAVRMTGSKRPHGAKGNLRTSSFRLSALNEELG